ncbi:hypothetical protein [Arsenicicoccus piscis]|nr:hypothetical protein [Arsenicicoccus piscis]
MTIRGRELYGMLQVEQRRVEHDPPTKPGCGSRVSVSAMIEAPMLTP